MARKLKDQLETRLLRAIDEKVFPGCVLGAFLPNGEKVIIPTGFHTYDNEKEVKEDTIYDVASVTKGVATASVLLSLVDEGQVLLGDPVAKYLPEFATSEAKEVVTIEHLLTYTVNLKVPTTSEILEMSLGDGIKKLLTADLRLPAGSEYLYTNSTALLMGLVVENVTNKSLDEESVRRFFDPLEMGRTTFHPEKFLLDEIAPAENKDRIGRVVHGVVHDEATHRLQEAGKYLGAAGLFSTVPDLLTFLEMLLTGGEYDGRRYFSAELVDEMLSPQFRGKEDTVGLGWNINTPRWMGEAATDATFGKPGFTGCVMVGDRQREAGFVLLSNHVHPKRRENSDVINAVRADVGDILWESLDG